MTVEALEAAVAALVRSPSADPLGLPLDQRRRARLRELAHRLLDEDPRRAGWLLWSTWAPSRRRS